MLSWGFRFRLRQAVKGSLWVLPVIGGVVGVLLSQFVLWLDVTMHVPAGWHYSATTASSVLSAIVGAMIALLGFVVTVGVLVVQQATGTLSPRFMRLWYRDRLQKAVLATFIGTFTYSFALLRRVETSFVPDLGITVAGFAVALSLALLLIYFDRFTHTLRPVAVAALVERAGERVLARWAPIFGPNDHGGGATTTSLPAAPEPVWSAAVVEVRADRAGAIQAVDVTGLLATAERHDCLLALDRTVGDFAAPGAVLVRVHRLPDGRGAPPSPRLLRRHVALGQERTIEQDPAFALRILVDIAIRALSPAVNDPTTAVQVLDYIDTYLRHLGSSELRRRYALRDRAGRVRVIVPGRGWEEYLQLAVTEIRAYGDTSIQVSRRLRAMLEGLLEAVPAPRRPAVAGELTRLDRALGRRFPDDADRALAGGSDRQGLGGPRPLPEALPEPPRPTGAPPPPAGSGSV